MSRMGKNPLIKIAFTIFPWGWAIIIGIACFLPIHEGPPTPPWLPYEDKIAHVILFLILGVSIVLNSRRTKWIGTGIILGLLYGGLVEVVQESLIEGRTGDYWDWLCDGIGLAFGVFVGLILSRFVIPKEFKP